MIIREAQLGDLEQLVELRMRFFTEMQEITAPEAEPALRAATLDYFKKAFDDGMTKTWVALSTGEIVATASLALFHRPPYLGNLEGKEAYLLNVYTIPNFRRRGISAQLLEQVTYHATHNGIRKMWLHASEPGRPLYERFGFRTNNKQMEWEPLARREPYSHAKL